MRRPLTFLLLSSLALTACKSSSGKERSRVGVDHSLAWAERIRAYDVAAALPRARVGEITLADDIRNALQDGAARLNGDDVAMARFAVDSVEGYVDERLRGLAANYGVRVARDDDAAADASASGSGLVLRCSVTAIDARIGGGAQDYSIPLSRIIKRAGDPSGATSDEIGVFSCLAEVYVDEDGDTVATGRGVGEFREPTEVDSQFGWNRVIDEETEKFVTTPAIGSSIKRAIEGAVAQALGQAIHSYLEFHAVPTGAASTGQ